MESKGIAMRWTLALCVAGGALAARAELPLALTAKNVLDEPRSPVPVTWGIPLAPEDGVTAPSQLDLTLGGVPVPVQMTPLARWGGAPDDSTRPIAWLLLDVQADLPASDMVRFQLIRSPRTDGTSPLRITRDDLSGVTVETGAATYSLSRTSFRLFDSVSVIGGPEFPGEGGIRYEGTFLQGPATILVEQSGPERVSLQVHGTVTGDIEYTARLQFYRGLAEVKCDFRLENLSPYTWVDGQPACNDYGTPGSLAFGDLSLVFPGYGPQTFTYASGEIGTGAEVTGTYTTDLALVQESSGGEHWDALLAEAPRLQSGAAKRASTIRLDGAASDGPWRLGGWLDAGGVTVAVEGIWQNFPKALRASGGATEAGIFPGEYSRDHPLRAGEFKTHTVWVSHHADPYPCAGSRARSALAPARLLSSPEALCKTRAAGLFVPRMAAEFPEYEQNIGYQITESPYYQEYPWASAAPTLQESLAIADMYGWVDYGDAPTDFEPFGTGILSAPFNTKYEGVRGTIYQALRTDDETWWEMAESGARHAGDIDVLHTRNRGRTAPRAWPDGGMYGHGYHDERGNTNPHRNFSNPNLYVTGAIPGMFLWAHLSGDTLLLNSALEASENYWWRVVHSSYPDDGGCAGGLRQCTFEPWTCEGWADADGNRAGGNILKTALSAYMATGDAAYLDLVSQVASFVNCTEARTGICCNRYHMGSTFVRNLGHYILLRRWLGLPEDGPASQLFQRRIDYQAGHLWNGADQTFSMCYDCETDPDWEDCDETFMCPILHNWLLPIADTFGLAALITEDPAYLTYGRPLLGYGSLHPMGSDSWPAYHFTKEYVNQVGYGNMFLYAWRQFYSGCVLSCAASATPSGCPAPCTVQFSASATATGCTGSPSFSWSFGDGGASEEQNPTHAYATSGTYTWTLTVTAGGETCTKTGTTTVTSLDGAPGDCDGDGIVSIGEVQKAINMFLGTQASGCGVDCNGDGTVSIGEVQKVINAFLGVATSC